MNDMTDVPYASRIPDSLPIRIRPNKLAATAIMVLVTLGIVLIFVILLAIMGTVSRALTGKLDAADVAPIVVVGVGLLVLVAYNGCRLVLTVGRGPVFAADDSGVWMRRS